VSRHGTTEQAAEKIDPAKASDSAITDLVKFGGWGSECRGESKGRGGLRENDSSVGLPPQIPPLGHLACLCSFMATMLVRL
jgi:hypothetical protein